MIVTEQVAGNMEALARTAKAAPPSTLVIFGANGDLTQRLLMPALYNLSGSKLLGDEFAVLGVDRDPGSDDDFRARQTASMQSFTPANGGEFAEAKLDDTWWDWLRDRLHYSEGDFTRPETFQALAAQLGSRNAIFYLAVADRFFGGIIDQLHQAGLTTQNARTFRRVVIEKPFGHDLASAKALNEDILSRLDESQIYRIDHFLGKETVQNILALRFANGFLEPLWNRDHIDHVEISAAETVGVEKRGKFYEATGALRDMVPNHMFQLLAMIAMEPPNSFDADAVRTEKAKVIEAIHPLTPEDVLRNVVRGQYDAGRMKQQGDVRAYTSEPNVAPDSRIETYVALRLTIDNWRWAGVPFYLRTGKRMAARKTEIAVYFKQAPFLMFRDTPVDRLSASAMVFHLQPHEGISLYFSAKQPGQNVVLKPVRMDFRYEDFFDLKPSTGYEALLYDVLIGDATLFNRADNVETGWQAVEPVLNAAANGGGDIRLYAAGSDGPAEADALLSQHGHSWRKLD